jgi:hypothetical protein
MENFATAGKCCRVQMLAARAVFNFLLLVVTRVNEHVEITLIPNLEKALREHKRDSSMAN